MIIITKTVGPVSIRYQAFSRPSRNPRTDYSVHSSIVLILLIRFPQSYNYKPPRASPRRHNITMSSFLTGLLWRYIGATAPSAGKAVYHRYISHVNILTMIQSWFLTWRRHSKTFINFTEPTIYSFTNGSSVGKMTVDIQIFLELQVEFPTIMWLLKF